MGWIREGKVLEEVPEGAVGFIYMITFDNGDFYIGRKEFFSTRRTKVKGKIRKKVTVKESNWKTYNSSSEEVKGRVENGEKHAREVIHLCASKACLMYFEVYEQMTHGVLCNPKAINKNILLRMFKCVESMK